MVQLSPSPALDVSPPPECSEEGKGRQGTPKTGSPKMGSPAGLSSLQLALAASSTTYPGYDMYIEDGLICIKHKIRNLQKKKLKLKDYMIRLKHGQTLNKDQLDAVEKYEEVIHNLAFARELHKTLEDLKQDLLKAQKKVVRKEQVAKVEAERRRLCTVLQVQDLLHSLQQEHVRKDLLSGLNRAPFLPAPELQSLLDLAALLGAKRDKRLSLEDQMERAALVYLDLLEGRDKPVAGSTYKSLKEQLIKLLDCGYFDRVIPPPPSKNPKGVETPAVKKTEASLRAPSLSTLSKLNTNDVPNREFLNRLYLPDTKPSVGSQADKTPPTHNWKAEFQAMKEQEPPDSWDMEFTDKAASPQPVVQKPLRGAVGFVPKVPASVKKPAAGHKQKREKKSKVAQDTKTATRGDTPVEVFNSPSALPKDPILRKQKLEDLMTKICGSYSFMQDSLLDGECSPTKGHPRLGRRASGSPSPLAVMDPRRSPVEVLPTTLHSIQLPARLLPVDDGGKANLTNGDQSLENCDLPFTAEDLALEPLQLPESQAFSSPPLYRRESPISISLEDKTRAQTPVSESGKQSPCNGVVPRPPTVPQERPFSTPPSRRPHSMPPPAPFQNMHSVFKVNAPLPPSGDLDFKCVSSPFSESNVMRFSTASTQTPPEFALPEDDQPAYQSECLVNGQIFLSPSQSGGTAARSGQSYYTRGSARGMTRGGKGLPHSFRSAGWHRGRFDGYRCGLRSPGGSFIHQAHMRDSVPILYGARDTGYQHSYKRGGQGGPRHNSSTGWSDSSLLSSPDREGNYTLVDSALGDSLSVSTMEVPVTPQGHTTTLLPMHLYPLSQPLRVAFTASRTANFTPGTLDQPIAFDLLHSNLGDMFDTHLGRFTCPANGTYVFIFHILKLAVNVPLYVNMMRNEEVMVSAYANDGAPDHETASNHAILPLYQGDQVWLRLHRGAIYGSSWKYSTFSGFLLYQD